MRPRTVLLALVAGIAALLTVGVAVTELAAGAVEFSLLLGLPAGVLAGLAAAAVVLARLESLDPARRRPAVVLVAFGGTFLAVLVGLAVGLGVRNSLALPVAAVLGVVAAAVAGALRGRRGGRRPDGTGRS